MLPGGACVTVWKDGGAPQPPEALECNQIGERLIRPGSERFWKQAFNIYYGQELIGACQKAQQKCAISISTQ
jgi:hypothetical protein